jgi:hypothetical protein
MTRKRSHFIFALFLASTAASLTAHAQTYQWKDGSGRTVISDTPPPASAKERRAIGDRRPAVVSEKIEEKPAEAPKTMAEKDLEFKKRQQEAREKAEKQAKEQAAEKERRESCENARRNLAVFETDQPVATYDESGQRKIMDSSERNQEIERARRFVADSCK